MSSYKTQKELVLQYLQDHGSITSKECMNKLDICDLQKAIQLLREENYDIKDKWIKKINKYGKSIKFKKYMLGGNSNGI